MCSLEYWPQAITPGKPQCVKQWQIVGFHLLFKIPSTPWHIQADPSGQGGCSSRVLVELWHHSFFEKYSWTATGIGSYCTLTIASNIKTKTLPAGYSVWPMVSYTKTRWPASLSSSSGWGGWFALGPLWSHQWCWSGLWAHVWPWTSVYLGTAGASDFGSCPLQRQLSSLRSNGLELPALMFATSSMTMPQSRILLGRNTTMVLKHAPLENNVWYRKKKKKSFRRQLFQSESTPFSEEKLCSENHILSNPWGCVGVGTEIFLHARRQRPFLLLKT